MTCSNIQSAFCVTGVSPFNKGAINKNQLAPSKETTTAAALPFIIPGAAEALSSLIRLPDDSTSGDDLDNEQDPTASCQAQLALANTSAAFLLDSSPITSESLINPMPPMHLPRTPKRWRIAMPLPNTSPSCHSFPKPLAPVSCFGHPQCFLPFSTKSPEARDVSHDCNATRLACDPCHNHPSSYGTCFLPAVHPAVPSYQLLSAPAGSAEQASPEHVGSGYCLTAYCHTHLSHRSDGCSCSRRLLCFPSDIYCSCVIFSYVPFCINTVASLELSPQTQSPRHQSSRPPSLLIALLITETALLIVAHGVHISLRHLRHPCPTPSISEGSFRLPLYLVAQSLYRAVTQAPRSRF
jgi:hypothetical protein